MVKIVCLGNEFLEEDCFAKGVGACLGESFDVVNVKDSFELMTALGEQEDFVILDVVEGLDEVVKLKVEDLRADSIVSAHDFDAVYVLKLLGEDVDIIGIPMSGNPLEITGEIKKKLAADYAD